MRNRAGVSLIATRQINRLRQNLPSSAGARRRRRKAVLRRLGDHQANGFAEILTARPARPSVKDQTPQGLHKDNTLASVLLCRTLLAVSANMFANIRTFS